MLYVIGFANLLLGIITFVYLFAGTERVTSFLYLSMLSSIVLNILFFVLIRKEGEKNSFYKKFFSILLLLLGDFELWFPIFTSPCIYRYICNINIFSTFVMS